MLVFRVKFEGHKEADPGGMAGEGEQGSLPRLCCHRSPRYGILPP